MNQSLSSVLDALKVVLQQEIVPQLESDYARSQIYGLVDVLDKLANLAVWSPDVMRRQLAVIVDACVRFDRRLEALGQARVPGVLHDPGVAMDQAQLEHALVLANRRLVELSDWLYSHDAAIDGESRKELEALLREAIRDMVAEERRLIAPTDFAALSGAAGA